MDLLIEKARYILTLDPKRRILRRASIHVRDDRIVRIGPADQVTAETQAITFDRVIDASRDLVMPGMVDAHLHLTEQLSRGIIPDHLRTVEWVYDYGKAVYSSMDPEDEYVATLFASLDMIKTGTTCFIDQGVYNPEMTSVRATAEIGIRGVAGRHAADKPPEKSRPNWKPGWLEKQYASTEETLKELERVVREYNNTADGRIRAWSNIEGKVHHTTDALYVGAKDIADRYGVGTMYHLASSIEEAQRVEQETGKWPVGHAYDIGALGSNVLLAHAVNVQEDEIDLLAETGTNVVFCPGTSMKLGKGAARMGVHDRMIDRGVNVALGCDGVCAFGSSDMVRQMFMASGLYRDGRMEPTILPAQTVLEMATLGGSRALLWDDEIGSLELGKKADIVLFDMDRPQWIPCHDPVQTLVYSADGASCETVLIDGKVVLEKGVLQTMDEGEILARARESAAKMAKKAGLRSDLLEGWEERMAAP
ncbi:MAG: amidohydrolase family protein [Nitrospinota bacterium]